MEVSGQLYAHVKNPGTHLIGFPVRNRTLGRLVCSSVTILTELIRACPGSNIILRQSILLFILTCASGL
jgi:hypothetical protein